MSEVIKTRWLTDNEQNKVAPKTLSSQVINEDGTLFKDTIVSSLEEKASQTDLDAVSDLVGDIPVSTQISNALENITVESITISEIDEICGATIYAASEVVF